MSLVYVSDHPLVRHKIALLRDESTPCRIFRELVRELSYLLFAEATRTLALERIAVRTPLADCDSEQLAEPVGIVPILRAGLGMADAMHDLLPSAVVWHLGLYRDHATHQPIVYYSKLPESPNITTAFIVDPMLATGGSATAAVRILKDWGVKRVIFIALIAAPEGVAVLSQEHPDVPIHLGAIDSHLDENCYIVPGLGDAGDRQFGTR